MLGEAANTIIFNKDSSTISGGSGDDIIINFTNNATINGGDGNNILELVHLGDGGKLNAGNGNNILTVTELHEKSLISMGDGNNVFEIKKLRIARISATISLWVKAIIRALFMKMLMGNPYIIRNPKKDWKP